MHGPRSRAPGPAPRRGTWVERDAEEYRSITACSTFNGDASIDVTETESLLMLDSFIWPPFDFRS